MVEKIDIIAAKLTAAMTGQTYVPTSPIAEPTQPSTPTPEPTQPKVAYQTIGKYLSLSGTEFGPTDTINVHWKADTARKDWVSVASKGMSDDTFVTYMNTGTDKTGTFTLTGLDPGEYEARIYLNYSSVGYKVADRLPFRVRSTQVASLPTTTASGALRSAYMSVTKKTFGAGETVEVSWFNTPGEGHDWITVVPKSSPDTEVGSYDYTKNKDGSFSVSGLAPGEYEARFYLNYKKVGYKVSDRLSFSVR
jgi:hypothetical protein